MKETHTAWILGGLALVLSAMAIVLNLVFAYTLVGIHLLSGLCILLFVAFGISLLAATSLVYLVIVYIRQLNNGSISFNHSSAWRRLGLYAGLAVLAALFSAIALVWLALRQHQVPDNVLQHSSRALLVLWFTLWGLSAGCQTALFTFVGFWTKRVLRVQSVGQLDLDFGIGLPQMDQIRPETHDTSRSFQSQDPTLASPPRTPTTPRVGSSLRHSSSTKVGPGSSRSKLLAKGSARSSLDLPRGDVSSIESGFDSWDTSSVHREIRAALHSSPSFVKTGLETIPGSRSVSPADALDGPFLPASPHATSSDTATALDWVPSSPPAKQVSSSPPSSPPNFSRPTSRSYNKPTLGTSMTELIHPLFRPNSPRPPPIAVAGTMVTASPLAGLPITPRTLARMRSNTLPQYWKPMPSPGTPNSVGSNLSSTGAGSPGPSIVDEELLPPFLPGFVLSAGQRSSLVGYGKRKTLKDRPKSAHSYSSHLGTMTG